MDGLDEIPGSGITFGYMRFDGAQSHIEFIQPANGLDLRMRLRHALAKEETGIPMVARAGGDGRTVNDPACAALVARASSLISWSILLRTFFSIRSMNSVPFR